MKKKKNLAPTSRLFPLKKPYSFHIFFCFGQASRDFKLTMARLLGQVKKCYLLFLVIVLFLQGLLCFTKYCAYLALAKCFLLLFYLAMRTDSYTYWPSSQTKYDCGLSSSCLIELFIIVLLPLHITPVIHLLCLCMQWVSITRLYLQTDSFQFLLNAYSMCGEVYVVRRAAWEPFTHFKPSATKPPLIDSVTNE